MKFGWLGWGIAAIVCGSLSRGFEAMGDAEPYAAEGVSGGRLVFHLLALILLIAAAVCGWRAVRQMMRGVRSGGPSPRDTAAVFEDAPASGEFDPDAALSRYLERRQEALPEPPRPAAPPSGFGRKGI
jgi:hypothetical protein